ncbi:MAG: thioredoxin domain-containing protein [Thermoleophilia bacterium]|jgi:predicted DsbA family dithiol-disulfide isomerase
MERQTENGSFRAEVEAQDEIARMLDIHAVPTYVINGTHRIVGCQPYAAFQEAIATLKI